MPKMDRGALQSMLAASKFSALAAVQSSQLTSERDDALMYYMGDMSKDMPAEDGRSCAVSSDVADTIEGLLPALMDIFCGADEVVTFNPTGPQDVQAAEQETDYINHVFMQQNPGFLVLYSFIKDALLSKVGVVKVWWEEREEEENETYYDLTDEQFAILSADEDVTITKHTEKPIEDAVLQMALQAMQQPGAPSASPPSPEPPKPPALHDAVATKSKKYAEAKVLGVPPEEFGIEKLARSIRTCNYCFHRTLQTQSALIKQGFNEEQVKTLPTYAAITNAEEINRDTVGEHQNLGEDSNKDIRQIEITEHYVRMDYEGDGKVKLYKVSTGGEQNLLMKKGGKTVDDGKDDIEEFDAIPFAAMTPVIVTHRFFGRSIADLVMDIQRIKTSLLRSLLDNAYLAVNPRVEVSESHASDNTLDDLLVSRPGGIVRTKQPGGLNWQEVPTVGNFVYPLLEYQDTTREMRTGVTKQGQGLDANALQNQSATAVNQMFTMAQARMKLIARIFAETGIKDLFLLLHATIRKHGSELQTVELRKQWVNVDPRGWKTRNDMTVHVGLGTGGKAEQMGLMNLIAALQEKALQGGLTNLVTPGNLYNTAKAITRIAGHKDVDAFFSDPKTQPPPQAKPDPKMMEIQAQAQTDQQQMQMKGHLDQQKMQQEGQQWREHIRPVSW